MTKANMIHEIERRAAHNWLQLKTQGLHILSTCGRIPTYHEYCEMCDNDRDYQMRLNAWYEVNTLCEMFGIDTINSKYDDVNAIHAQSRQIDSLVWKSCQR